MLITKKGLILPEEKPVEDKLKVLPDTWWCLGGDANRFPFNSKGSGAQVDFILVSPRGVFFIESKNVHLVRRNALGDIQFLNSSRKLLQTFARDGNPVEDCIRQKYMAKDWLTAKAIPDFFLKGDNSGRLKVFLHSFVVLVNEDNVRFENCSYENLQYVEHRYPSLVKLSLLQLDFFSNFPIPSHCAVLNPNEMWLLFKLFLNPDMSLGDILGQVKELEYQMFEEKRVLSENIKILEEQNILLEQQSQRLSSLNAGLEENIKTQEIRVKKLEDVARLAEDSCQVMSLNNKQLYESRNEAVHESQSMGRDLKLIQNRLHETSMMLQETQEKNRELKKRIVQSPIDSNHRMWGLFSFGGWILFIVCGIAIFLWHGIFVQENSSVLARLEKKYGEIRRLTQEKKYGDVVSVWQEDVLLGGDFNFELFQEYQFVFFMVAYSYEFKQSYDNAIKYYNIFEQVTRTPRDLLKSRVRKSLSRLALGKQLDLAVFDLLEALKIAQEEIVDPVAEADVLLNLGRIYWKMYGDRNELKRYRRIFSGEDFVLKSLSYYKQALEKSGSQKRLKFSVTACREAIAVCMDAKRYVRALAWGKLLLKKVAGVDYFLMETMLTHYDLGRCYVVLGSEEQALLHLREALNQVLSLELKGEELVPYRVGIVLQLIPIMESLGRWKDAHALIVETLNVLNGVGLEREMTSLRKQMEKIQRKLKKMDVKNENKESQHVQ